MWSMCLNQGSISSWGCWEEQANITLSWSQMVTQSKKHACFPEQEIGIGHIAVPLNREVQNFSRITASLTDVVPVKLTCVFSFTRSGGCGIWLYQEGRWALWRTQPPKKDLREDREVLGVGPPWQSSGCEYLISSLVDESPGGICPRISFLWLRAHMPVVPTWGSTASGTDLYLCFSTLTVWTLSKSGDSVGAC